MFQVDLNQPEPTDFVVFDESLHNILRFIKQHLKKSKCSLLKVAIAIISWFYPSLREEQKDKIGSSHCTGEWY